ncbi:50S ribosomal protein L6 [Candidatus Peregrinibacteria bacterium]|nr:50S ribosomal protein L6 [Candidatus Peregrinibacteria bacterium]
MSRIGKKPVSVPSGVTVQVTNGVVRVQGPKGELTYKLLPEVSVHGEGNIVRVERSDDSAQSRARHGLTRALIANMVRGVHEGYVKELEIIGVGYKAQLKGKVLSLNLGFSNPVDLPIPEGLTIAQDAQNKNVLNISGIDKHLVGEFSAQIRSLRPPEPYKGKGIRYRDEKVRRKVGKAAVTTTKA